jgi:hypothetical protein
MIEETAVSGLSEAAEELIKAAPTVVKTSSQRNDVSSLEESLDTKINAVNQNVCNLKDSIERQTKMQSLEWAIQNMDLFESYSFQYYVRPLGSGDTKQSKYDAKHILLSFRQGYSCYIDDGDMAEYHHDSSEKTQSEFRDRLVNHIFALTGVEPRLERKDDARYIMFYS